MHVAAPHTRHIYYERSRNRVFSELSFLINGRLHAVVAQAFRAIDEKGCGYIETAKMNELLVSKGTPFRAKEIEAFLSVAKVGSRVYLRRVQNTS